MKRSEERIQFLADILSTAIEGGVNYWAQVDEYKWENVPETYAVIEDMSDNNKSYRVDLDVIARGLNRIADGTVSIASAQLQLIKAANQQNDCMPEFTAQKANFGGYFVSDIDADVADNILQAGLFNEITYG